MLRLIQAIWTSVLDDLAWMAWKCILIVIMVVVVVVKV
jgi:hypothetical protein